MRLLQLFCLISACFSTTDTGIDGAIDVTSLLKFSPTRVYDTEFFVCEITHPSFDETSVKTFLPDVRCKLMFLIFELQYYALKQGFFGITNLELDEVLRLGLE